MSYGATFTVWRAAAGDTGRAYTPHAFVEGMRDGTLPPHAFLRHLVQDHLFLIHSSSAWALAVTKAKTLEEMGACAATVHALLDDEMRVHVQTCAADDIPEAELFAAREAPQNIAYTRYVLDAGHLGDFLDLKAAPALGALGYGEIGARLADEGGQVHYTDWIATYSGEDGQHTCHEVGALVDAAAERRLGPAPEDSSRWPNLCTRFLTGTRLEADFWSMGLST